VQTVHTEPKERSLTLDTPDMRAHGKHFLDFIIAKMVPYVHREIWYQGTNASMLTSGKLFGIFQNLGGLHMSQEANRNRMIVDLPSEVQMAIKLRAVKSSMTTGDVVSEAVQRAFSKDIEEARATIAENRRSRSDRS
jgi:hypothetical protein